MSNLSTDEESNIYSVIKEKINDLSIEHKTSGCMKLLGHLILHSGALNEAYSGFKKMFKTERREFADMEDVVGIPDERWRNHNSTLKHTFSETAENATMFLARVRGRGWLDWNYGYRRFNFSSAPIVPDEYYIHCFVDAGVEEFKIYTKGAFNHYFKLLGSYKDISEVLTSMNLSSDFQNFKAFMKTCLRGGNYLDAPEGMQEYLLNVAQLMFDMEVRRNTGALLTNAMYFDLLFQEGGYDYKLENMSNAGSVCQLPMAMINAALASVTIDKLLGVLWYDKREASDDDKARELAALDKNIVQDWLKWKKDNSAEIAACFKGDDGVINEAPRRVLYELIDDWYGVKLEELNSDELLSLN